MLQLMACLRREEGKGLGSDCHAPSTAHEPTGSPGWMRARMTTVTLLLLLLPLLLLFDLQVSCAMFLWPSVEHKLFIFQPLAVQLQQASGCHI